MNGEPVLPLRLRFTLWALPGWLGMAALWIENLTRHDYNMMAWRAASQGMFVSLLTPLCAGLLLRAWLRARGLRAVDHVMFTVLAAPP